MPKNHTSFKSIEYQKGDQLGYFEFVDAVPEKLRNRKAIFKCFCGNQFVATVQKVKSYRQQSCGCVKKRSGTFTHGKTETPEYRIWCHMKGRCNNPTDQKYKNYGGRGIQVCERWNNSFENFLIDMGNRPTSKHSIDRINVNGDYESDNCRWTTSDVQINNKTDNVYWSFEGKTLTVAQWEREKGINRGTLQGRRNNGWDLKRILTQPIRSLNKKQDAVIGNNRTKEAS